MRISDKGLNLIKEFEGCRLNAYKCAAGVWTIGYGHTGEVNGKAICNGLTITQKQADELLRGDMQVFENTVNTVVTVPITQNMFDALVSFSFNVGGGALRKSTLLKKLNSKDYTGAADEFAKWNKAGGQVLKGLVRRRKAERALFLDGANEVTERLVTYQAKTKVNYRSEPYVSIKTWRGQLQKGQKIQVVWGSGTPDKDGTVWVKFKLDKEYFYVMKKAVVAL